MTRILFFADEFQRGNFKGVLELEERQVIYPSTVAAAFEETGPYDLLIVQVVMLWDADWLGNEDAGDRRLVRQTGVELASRLFKENKCPVVFLCYGPGDRSATQEYKGGRYYAVQLPLLPSRLMRVVDDLLEENNF